MKIIFKLYNQAENTQELTPVIMQVTTTEEKLYIPTAITMKPAAWDASKQRATGNSLHAIENNLYLVRLETKLLEYYNTCLRHQQTPTPDEIVQQVLKNDEEHKPVMTPTLPVPLSFAELKSVQSLYVKDASLDKVRDVYLFICYTGVPYHYVSKLDRGQLRMINSQWCIRPTAETPFAFPVRLVKKAVSIIRKWEGNYKPVSEQLLLPDISGLSVSTILQELAQLAQVETSLSWDNAIKTHWETFTPSNVLR